MKKMLTMFAAAMLAAGAGATEFMVECEGFPTDTGFKVDHMGASSKGAFLQLAKRGAAASAKTAIPEAGDYYVWVRDFSYGQNNRKGTVFLNGKKVGSFGDKKSPDGKSGTWMWTRSMLKTHLEAGELEIKLVSNSEYARFDMIIFTTDENFKPEGKAEDVAELELVD